MDFPEVRNLVALKDANANPIIENRDSNSSNSTVSLYYPRDNMKIFKDTFQSENSIQVNTSELDDVRALKFEKKWTKLPSPAIERIYSFLSRSDQSRMSQVCSRWSNSFNSPSLWKKMTFYLPEHNHFPEETYPEVRFARKYAPMFRHVEIICKGVRSHLTKTISKQLKFFLKAMESSSQLVSISFIGMEKYFLQLDIIIFEYIFKMITSFFNSQRNLKKVVFQDSSFSKEEGMELLKAIFHSDRNTISSLTLRGFVNEGISTVLNEQYSMDLTKVCCRIANVQSLEIDYTQIFEDVIDNLYEMLCSGDYQPDKQKHGEMSLNIFCEDRGRATFRGIKPGTWKYLTKVFPELKVKMDITIRNNLRNEMAKFLVREMPLESLDFRFKKQSTSVRSDISDFFLHLEICKYQNSLKVLNVLWLPSVPDFVGSVVPFVKSCKKLKTLHLHTHCAPVEIDVVLKAFLENHPPSLKSITLWFNKYQEREDEEIFSVLSEKYYLLFKSQGIECFLIVDPDP